MASTYVLRGRITNTPDYRERVYVVVMEREPDGTVVSGDIAEVGTLGAFVFMLDGTENRYVVAFADTNGNEKYDEGEPAWVHADEEGNLEPVAFLPEVRKSQILHGNLSTDVVIPRDLIASGQAFRRGRPLDEVVRGWNIPIILGEVVDLDDPRFSAVRGKEGIWEPLAFPMKSGIGIFFLEEYDSTRVPVLFVYGAAGSPQDWATFFQELDRTRYQPWFYFYPTGRRLDEMSDFLSRGVGLLHEHYGFERMHVVAHSMGGLVSRSFVIKHLLHPEGGEGEQSGDPYIDTLVTISTPWGGHEAARLGTERAPAVVPSWYDLNPGSDFLQGLFTSRLRGRIEHHLLFGYDGSRSMILPTSNDGTVSVASQLAPEAQEDAIRLYGFNASHVGILSDADVVRTVHEILGRND